MSNREIPAGSTGYYRFTDIFFEWHKALPNLDDIRPLKALLDYTALVHEEHPLREPGVNGIKLYLGTFENGEMRLLFSSKQVEYLRYYLQVCRCTKTMIPIPSTEYLILPGDLRNCSPDVYRDPAVLKRSIKNIDKNNKRLKGAGDILGLRRLTFERVRTLWAARLGTWCAMDFEAWDRDHTLLTEFGWSVARWPAAGLSGAPGPPGVECGHLIVKERRHYTQTYVANNKENYDFGQSELVDRHEFKRRIIELIEANRQNGPLFLVFHDNSQDVKYLMMLEALERIEVLVDAPQNGEIYCVDTADLFAALEGDSSGQMRSLERVCRHLQIPTQYLHNAGNDAHYTLDAMMAMASGDPVDQQREMRWPNRTADAQPKVQFHDWEDDDEVDDMEGIFGFPRGSTRHMTFPDEVEDEDEADGVASPTVA